jgi:hypothetical protein
MWLYVPPEYCPSAPALEESTSVSDSPSPAPVLFVSLSGKPAQRPLSWPEWKNRPWIKRLSGTICRPSMAARGVERWISSLQDCPASPTPSQEPKKATPTIELSGPSSCASSEKCAPPLVFIENVSTFVTRGWFRPAGEKLCELGYEIEDPFFLRAGDVGAPHRRERVFILAHRTGGRQTEWPGRRCGELDHSDSRRSESTEHLICPRGDIAELAGGELANAQCIRCADGGPTPQIRPEARPECRGTGHHASTQPPPCINSASTMPSSCGRPPQPTRRSRDRTNRTDDGGNLWSALRGDRPGRGSGQRRGQGWGPSGGQQERSDAPLCGMEMGNARCEGNRRCNQQHGEGADQEPTEGPGQPLPFPPGRGDYARWLHILERWPHLEPAISGVAYGPSSRVDQLRLGGNGVVPLVVAVAFRMLTDAAQLSLLEE